MKEKIDRFHNQVQKNLKWNLVMYSFDGMFYSSGMAFGNPTTILPAFVTLLTGSDTLVGLIPTIVILGWLLPQLISAYFTQAVKLKKKSVLKIAIGQRLPWLLVGLSIVFFGRTDPQITTIAFFALFIIVMFSNGVAMPVWMDFVGKTVSTNWRGRLAGIRGSMGGFLGIGVGIVVGQILEKYAFPVNYSICFFMCFLFTTISTIFIALIKETEYPIVKERIPLANYIRKIPEILRKNRNYLFFLISQVLLKGIAVAGAFYTVCGIKRFNVAGSEIATFLILFVVGRSLSTFIFGHIGDYRGHILSIRLACSVGILGVTMAWLATSVYHLFIAFILQGIYIGGNMASVNNVLLEFSRPEERPTYMGLANTIVAPFAGFLPLLAGILLESMVISYRITFLISGIMALTGLMILIFAVTEPRLEIKEAYQ